MGQGISEVLPFAIGIAISPVPIIAVILILFSNRARVNGPVFLAGWVIGLTAVGTVVYVVSQAAGVGTDSTSSDTVSWGKIVLGVALLGLARRNWAKRPKAGATPQLPKWMATVESITPVRAFVLTLLLSVVNPKNLILAVGAAAGLGRSISTRATRWWRWRCSWSSPACRSASRWSTTSPGATAPGRLSTTSRRG